MSDDGAVHRHVLCIRVLHQNTIITIIVDVKCYGHGGAHEVLDGAAMKEPFDGHPVRVPTMT